MTYKRPRVWVLVPQDSCNGEPRVFASEQGLQDYLDFHEFLRGTKTGSTHWAHDQDAGVWYYMEREVQ